MSAIVSVDFDLDGDVDLLAREKATGYLWLYPGKGAGFAARRKVGSGWTQFTSISSPGIIGVNPFVYATTAAGEVVAFVGTGDGRFDNASTGVVGSGFKSYRVTS